MCRILALSASEISYELLKNIVDAFVKSNEHDPYLSKLTGKSPASHDDGWGLAAAGLVGGSPTIAWYKSVEPIFYESSKRILELYTKRISSYDTLYFVVHARKASRREPYGIEYAHPFMRASEQGIAWFVHNGGADKKALAEKLGVNPWLRVDSELLGYYIMDSVLSCTNAGRSVDDCVVEAYSSAKHYVVKGSALNTALLLLHEERPYLYVSYWVNEPASKLHEEYYSYIALNWNNAVLAGSISIKDYLPADVSDKVVFLEHGVYRLEPGRITKLSGLQ
ncbi:MAG: class II glutamine amidotransferase [Desulfurococcaceae archaeon]